MNYLEKLNKILIATSWSQEELARRLEVSFPALNAWLNERAIPRRSAIVRIDELFLSVIGAEEVSEEELENVKTQALRAKLTAKSIINNPILLERLTIHLTYHTNTIEGSTMTMADVKNVLYQDKVLGNRTAIEQAEARNHQAALYWLLDELTINKEFTITEDIILGLHLRLMNGIVGDAGQYRRHSVRIMGTHVPLANWQKIPVLIADYTQSLQDENSDLVASIAKSHATFEKIHPFSDGNGRTGRLLILAQALSRGIAPPIIPRERKQAYYKYLELAQVQDKFSPLEMFIAESIIYSETILKQESQN
jgi:Fic family protein